MDEVARVAALLSEMGASGSQAEVMARQLIKRAEQQAAERGTDKVAALSRLLELVHAGRRGETYEGPDSEGEGEP